MYVAHYILLDDTADKHFFELSIHKYYFWAEMFILLNLVDLAGLGNAVSNHKFLWTTSTFRKKLKEEEENLKEIRQNAVFVHYANLLFYHIYIRTTIVRQLRGPSRSGNGMNTMFTLS
uniref:Uncharacterized protein n=1 Tax=Glossina pallidipes TaxID=7398 RepID=A0A1A9Z219_GLOPL